MNLICRYCGTAHPNAIVEYISETEADFSELMGNVIQSGVA